jgi:uncharacterized MnhB-related membrane protein
VISAVTSAVIAASSVAITSGEASVGAGVVGCVTEIVS